MGRLDGKVAVVTGAGTGIGRATAQLYAREGAKVVVADVRPQEGEATVRSIANANGDAIFVATDVSRSDQVQELFRATESHYGALHVMTANAGITGRAHGIPLADLAEDDFQQLIDVNLVGVFLCLKYAIAPVRRSGGGAFTVTSSLAAARGYTGLTAYSASKGGVNGMVRALALELAPEIRVNIVMPGSVATDVGRHWAEELGTEFVARTSPSAEEESYRWLGDPIQLAHAHLWLASEDSSFVTGQEIPVDGGRSVATIGSWTISRNFGPATRG